MALKDVEIGYPGNTTPPVDRLIRAAKANEELGVHSLWWPDHLMSWQPQSIWVPELVEIAKFQKTPHIYLDTVAAMTVAAMVTERVKIGCSVTEPFRRHPAMIAQEFLTLDHISKGRVILGIGAGERENLEPYGIEFSQPASHLEEAIKIIRLLWETDEPVNFEGRFWPLKDAVLGLRPYEPGKYPPIWLGVRGPRLLKLTGRLGDGWCASKVSLRDYGEKLSIIRQAAQESGRDPDAITPSLTAFVVVDRDHETCHKLLDTALIKSWCLALPAEDFERLGFKHPLGETFYGVADYVPSRWSQQEMLELISKIPREVAEEHLIHGTPEDIAERIGQYADKGLRHIMLRNITFFSDMTKVGSSYALLGEVVKYIKGLA
ncbi:MAG: LLM class flavin-dependent oxidoreductase [Chloroflexi bacterium]|nr:LLM class flavin-dependent oxidoreductase [Chloroflexota bacterium]